MRRIRLDVGYDGTDFCGWQIQPAQRTVQGVLEQSLKELLGESVRVIGSGRTDAGVHAERQTCHFDTENKSIPADRLAPALNAFLPRDLRAWQSTLADCGFHARFSATERIYRYRFYPACEVPPFWRNCCWGLRKRVSIGRLNSLAALFIGKHDFTAFCAAGDKSRSKVRTVNRAVFFEEKPFLIFEISGNAFLWNMVRSLVGTIIEFYSDHDAEDHIKKLLETGNRSGCGTTAPSCGLTLVKVSYEPKK